MTYAKVINNEIVEYNRTLPFSTDTTSFGVGTDAETLKEFGYLPIIGSEPEYDINTYRVNGVTYTVNENEVIKNYDVVEISAEELAKQELDKNLQEAHSYLNTTDYKMLNHYVAKEYEDIEAIIIKRNEYREFIRANE